MPPQVTRFARVGVWGEAGGLTIVLQSKIKRLLQADEDVGKIADQSLVLFCEGRGRTPLTHSQRGVWSSSSWSCCTAASPA